MPKYEVTLIEKMIVSGTVTIEADTPEEAEELARDRVLEDYDAAEWGDAERLELYSKDAEEQP